MRANDKSEPSPAPKLQPDDPTAKRLRTYVQRIAAGRPEIWARIDEARALRGVDDIPTWPAWCFLPSGASHALLKSLDPEAQTVEGAALSALAPWRVTQGIYRYHAETLEALWRTPVTGNLPPEALYAIPEWCVYIETPGRSFRDREIFGFFAWLDFETATDTPWLRLAADYGEVLDAAIPMPLVGTIEQSIAEWLIRARRHQPDVKLDKAEKFAGEVEPMISLLLYLCSTNAEIRAQSARKPLRPKPQKTKAGMRLFPPPQATPWEVGWRIGAAIQAAKEADRRWKPGDGTHASPRPHIRRSHWHSFWTGPKAKVGELPPERKLVLKWLPPIPVNVEEDAEVVPTIHPVR